MSTPFGRSWQRQRVRELRAIGSSAEKAKLFARWEAAGRLRIAAEYGLEVAKAAVLHFRQYPDGRTEQGFVVETQ